MYRYNCEPQGMAGYKSVSVVQSCGRYELLSALNSYNIYGNENVIIYRNCYYVVEPAWCQLNLFRGVKK
jgi:hypothetical protein